MFLLSLYLSGDLHWYWYCWVVPWLGDASSGMCFMPCATIIWALRACFNDGQANCLIGGASIKGIVHPYWGSVCKVLHLLVLLLMLHCFDYGYHEHDCLFNPLLLLPAWRPVKLDLVLSSWHQQMRIQQNVRNKTLVEVMLRLWLCNSVFKS